MSVRFYFDHNMQQAVATALRNRGIDVLTLRDDGHERHSDMDVLHRATTLERVIVTRDQDFWNWRQSAWALQPSFRASSSAAR